MLHIVTQIGVPGRQERQKRHFDIHNRPGPASSDLNRARRYIPHGYGEEESFRPHPQKMAPKYTDYGPDWKSRPRRIPSPKEQENKPEIWPDWWHSLRTYPYLGRKTYNEFKLFPGAYDSTLRSKWLGDHKASQQSEQEVSQDMLFGNKRKVWVVDKRNGLPMAAPGDKNYQAPEYSQSFHKLGSTLPVANFGIGKTANKREEVLVLQELPRIPREPFLVKEQHRQRSAEISEVQHLETWRPATPLLPPPRQQEA